MGLINKFDSSLDNSAKAFKELFKIDLGVDDTLIVEIGRMLKNGYRELKIGNETRAVSMETNIELGLVYAKKEKLDEVILTRKRNTVLDRYKVVKIVKMLDQGKTIDIISKKFKVGRSTIKRIKSGETWNDITNMKSRDKKIGNTKLNKSQVLGIIKLLDKGENQTKIAEKFGVKRNAIVDIQIGKTWNTVTNRKSL